MQYQPQIHQRRSLRLPTYDYTDAGAYFITVCTHNREVFLLDRLIREIVSDAWHELPHRFPPVSLDQFIIMPNHIHGIIWIVRGDPSVGAQHRAWPDDITTQAAASNPDLRRPSNDAAPLRCGLAPGSLGAIVRAFKSRSAKRINRLRRTPGASVWQRNYYEHIVRNESDLARIRQYIIDNPAKWAEDADNPANWSKAPHRRGAA